MWPVSDHPQGCVVQVKAQPGAKRNELRLDSQGQIRICVTQQPEKGKANRAVLEVLAKSLDVKSSQLEILSGETSRHKRILITGLGREEIAERFRRLLESK